MTYFENKTEMLTIPDHKENENPNHIKIPLYSYRNGYHQETNKCR
jgi:hypothetical protein